MFEKELAEIERLVSQDEPEKALKIAKESIFFVYQDHQFDQGYRDAWEKAKELTTVPVQMGDEEVRATVVNDLSAGEEFGETIWHLQIAGGYDTFHFAVAARNEQDALDAYADNEYTCNLTLQTDDTMDDDDCLHLGNAGERHYFENYALDAMKRPTPEGPFVRTKDMTPSLEPARS